MHVTHAVFVSLTRTVHTSARLRKRGRFARTSKGDEMSLSRDSRQERKLKAFRRAQFRLKQNLERIDWEEDCLLPEIEALKSGKSVLGLPAGVAFDIQIHDENSPDDDRRDPDQ